MSERIKSKMKCPVCGAEVEGTRKDTYCIECRAKARLESQNRVSKRMTKIHKKEKEIKKNTNEKRCLICGIILNNTHHNARFCPVCQTAVQKVKVRRYQKEKEDSWRNLTEEERLNRMQLVSEKLLSGEIK